MKAWTKFFVLISISSVFLGASEPLREVTDLAASLDELVQQRAPFRPNHFEKGARLYAGAPEDLNRIVSITSDMLKIDKPVLTELLGDDRQPLSRIVYARLLGAKRNVPWKPLLINGEDLIEALQQEGVRVEQIHGVLENLYTELSFASLDSPVIPDRRRRGR